MVSVINSDAICGMVFCLLLSGQASAWCELDNGYKLPENMDFNKYCDFNEGLGPVVKDGKYGFVDKKGKIVIIPKYEDAQNFSEGLAPIKKMKNGVLLMHKVKLLFLSNMMK